MPGNLYVVTHVEEHPILKRDGTELYQELRLSITQAALGAQIAIVTPDGEEMLDIKPGTQPGTEIRRRGKGVPHLRRPGTRGDLHVLIDVEVPTRLNDRQRELLEQFAVESGDLGADGHAAAGGSAGTRRGKKSLGDRIKDAIN
jgi:molecular chaperone DnaJ